MTLKRLDLKISWYVLDAEKKLIVSEVEGPSDKPWIIRDKAQRIAQE